MREVRPTKKEEEYITHWYGKKKAKDMAKELDISVNRVYNICQFFGFKHLNYHIIMTTRQYQLIIGGVLGDGNIKRNGSNFYYRESHSSKEKEYCYWKYKILEDMISKKGFGITDKRDNQYGFQTINAAEFRWIKNMTKTDVIHELNTFGAVIYLLDDGWTRSSGYNLSTGVLTTDEVLELKTRLDTLFDINCAIISNKTISIHKKDIKNVLWYFDKYIPNSIDIYKKKIKPLVIKFKGYSTPSGD